MKDQIVLIQCSSRADGDSGFVCREISKIQDTIGHIDINALEISAFDYQNKYESDDFLPTIKQLNSKFDTWIFVTPVYWYSMSGQMKIFLDRITDLLKWHKDEGRKLRGKSMGLISVSNDPELQEHFEVPVKLSAGYLGMRYIGHCHTWVEEGILSEEVKERLNVFLNSI